MAEISLFDHLGHFRMPADDVIAGLSDERLESFLNLKEASMAVEAADAELKVKTAEHHKCVADHIAARENLAKINPPQTFMQALKQSQEAWRRAHGV